MIWNLYGMYMEFIRNLYIECIMDLQGIDMECIGNLYGNYIEFMRIYEEFIWNVQGVRIAFIQNLY